jgi:hypothetical protein
MRKKKRGVEIRAPFQVESTFAFKVTSRFLWRSMAFLVLAQWAIMRESIKRLTGSLRHMRSGVNASEPKKAVARSA